MLYRLDLSLGFVQKRNDVSRKIPQKKSETTDNRILTLVKRDPFMSSRQIVGKIKNELCSGTIQRRLQGANVPGRIGSRFPNPHNLKNRLKFVKSQISGKGATCENKGRNIKRTDKCKINLF